LAASEIVLEQFASSQSILTEDEKDLGVCMVDIGGGTTDIAIFTEGSIRHTSVIPIAGDQVTNDIAIALRTPTRNAEDIKLRYASALQDLADTNQMIDIPSPGTGVRHISQRALAEIVEARYEELFTLVAAEIRRSGLENFLAAGIVLTGGGSKVLGGVELAERVFRMPVRVGVPSRITGLTEVINNPVYATSVGLLIYGMQQQRDTQSEMSAQTGMKSVWQKMKEWF
jgi:cell division protein FtsA